jgi:hypothetical protein
MAAGAALVGAAFAVSLLAAVLSSGCTAAGEPALPGWEVLELAGVCTRISLTNRSVINFAGRRTGLSKGLIA